MTPRNHIASICLLCSILCACASPVQAPHPGILPTSVPVQSITPSPAWIKTPQPTATGTVAPTSTLLPAPSSMPTPAFAWGGFPGPTEVSEIEIPRLVPPINLPHNAVNIILLGSDRRPHWGYYHTDAVMILSLNPDAGTATFISIPRDLYVYIPGWKVNRINTADYRGGFEMTANTVLYNLGVPLHHWVRVEYTAFREAIDALGGIDVRPAYYLKDTCARVTYEYSANVTYHMDGTAAMCYATMRMQSSDFDRVRRQQEIMQALFNKIIRINGLWKAPELYDTFEQYVKTDMTLEDALPLIPLAARLALDRSRIRYYRIDHTMVESWRTPQNGYYVLLPETDLIQAMLQQALGTP